MSKKESYIIQISKLKKGDNLLEYEVDKELFDDFGTEDVEDVKCHLDLNAKKTERMIEFVFNLNGEVSVLCGRCLKPMTIQVKTNDILYVKFGEKYEEVDDNEIVIPENENEVNLSQFIFDAIMLQIPISPIHDDIKDCDKEMIEKLASLNNKGVKDKDEIDPRWEKLKELKQNK
jgi:uncharacterized metal-binding protein YceD (DUF177 family)